MSKEENNGELPALYSFTLELKEVPVKLVDPRDGEEHWYLIREMNALQRDKWFENVSGRMRMNEKGDVTGVRNFTGMQATLLTLTMLEAEDEGSEDEPQVTARLNKQGKPIYVTETAAQLWPASVQAQLFEIAQRISGLDDEAKERSKKD